MLSEDGLNGGQRIEPRDEFRGGFAVEHPSIELLTDFEREAGDFSVSCGHGGSFRILMDEEFGLGVCSRIFGFAGHGDEAGFVKISLPEGDLATMNPRQQCTEMHSPRRPFHGPDDDHRGRLYQYLGSSLKERAFHLVGNCQ